MAGAVGAAVGRLSFKLGDIGRSLSFAVAGRPFNENALHCALYFPADTCVCGVFHGYLHQGNVGRRWGCRWGCRSVMPKCQDRKHHLKVRLAGLTGLTG